jgi:hypothetical protein
MESVDSSHGNFLQDFGTHAESGAVRAGIVDFHLDFGVFGIDAIAAVDFPPALFGKVPEPLVLVGGVKHEVVNDRQHGLEFGFGVRRRVHLDNFAELFFSEKDFIDAACGNTGEVRSHVTEDAPRRKRFHGKQDFATGTLLHFGMDFHVPAQGGAVNDVVRRVNVNGSVIERVFHQVKGG